MKPLFLSAAALTLVGGLAACSPKPATVETAAAPKAAPAAPAASTDQMAKGAGTVKAVDAAAGTITLEHGPIAEAGWPAMTMTFKAAPDVAKAAKVGDKVAFDLKLQGGGGEVTAIQKR